MFGTLRADEEVHHGLRADVFFVSPTTFVSTRLVVGRQTLLADIRTDTCSVSSWDVFRKFLAEEKVVVSILIAHSAE